jgi:hypothetical protein
MKDSGDVRLLSRASLMTYGDEGGRRWDAEGQPFFQEFRRGGTPAHHAIIRETAQGVRPLSAMDSTSLPGVTGGHPSCLIGQMSFSSGVRPYGFSLHDLVALIPYNISDLREWAGMPGWRCSQE